MNKLIVLAVVCLSNFLTTIMGSAVNVALPTIGREFSVDAVTLSWMATGFLLAVAVFMVPCGKLADIHGRKKLFLYGILGWTVTSLLCGIAVSAQMLVATRVLQGITGAMFFATSTAILTSVYPPQERGHALGIYTSAVYAGLAIGPTLGGIITQQIGWRSMFFANSLLGAGIACVLYFKIKAEWADARGEKLDLVGSVLFGFSLMSAMYGFSALPATFGFVCVAVGIGCLVAFVFWENRVPNPVLDINHFRHNIVFSLSNAAAFANYAATAAITFLLSLYLQYVRGLDAQTAGLVLLAQPIMMVIFSPLAGRLSDRIAPSILASIGMAITTLGLAMLIFLNDSLGIGYIVAALVVAGIGFGVFSSPNTNAVMSSVERRYLGVASATLGTMRSVGQMLSLGIATLIIAVYVGGVQITPEHHATFSAAFRLSFIISAVLCAVGVLCSLARGKVRPTH